MNLIEKEEIPLVLRYTRCVHEVILMNYIVQAFQYEKYRIY